MSDTPRTDATIDKMSRDVSGFLEFVGHAHTLEREGNQLRAALGEAMEKLGEAHGENANLRAEVIRLREDVANERRRLEWEIYRPLKEGEMVRVGDYYLEQDADDWKLHDDPACDRPAPCPNYPAHVHYRRHIADELRAEVARLTADKDRLDWMEMTADGINWQLNNTNRITRASIDAARSALAGEGKK